MSEVVLLNNKDCEQLLSITAPHLIHDMSEAGKKELVGGGSTIITAGVYNEGRTLGMFVTYFGLGCAEDDNGWLIRIFPAKTPEEFEKGCELRKAEILKYSKGTVQHFPRNLSSN